MSEPLVLPRCDCKDKENQVCAVCQIWMPEINRLKGELEEAKQKYKKQVRLHKQTEQMWVEHRKLWEDCKIKNGILEAQLSRYKEGVEVDVFGTVYGSGRIIELEEAFMRLLNKRVRVLVMKEVE